MFIIYRLIILLQEGGVNVGKMPLDSTRLSLTFDCAICLHRIPAFNVLVDTVAEGNAEHTKQGSKRNSQSFVGVVVSE